MRIEFKERRTEITQEDINERITLAKSITTELKKAPEFFSRDIMRFQDRHVGVITGESQDIEEVFSFDEVTLSDDIST